jgi:hypothetical protein
MRNIAKKQSLAGKHSYIASVDMQGSEAACSADPRIQEEIRALHLPEEAVAALTHAEIGGQIVPSEW